MTKSVLVCAEHGLSVAGRLLVRLWVRFDSASDDRPTIGTIEQYFDEVWTHGSSASALNRG